MKLIIILSAVASLLGGSYIIIEANVRLTHRRRCSYSFKLLIKSHWVCRAMLLFSVCSFEVRTRFLVPNYQETFPDVARALNKTVQQQLIKQSKSSKELLRLLEPLIESKITSEKTRNVLLNLKDQSFCDDIEFPFYELYLACLSGVKGVVQRGFVATSNRIAELMVSNFDHIVDSPSPATVKEIPLG